MSSWDVSRCELSLVMGTAGILIFPSRPRLVQFKHTMKWQPLLESDGLGYVYAPEHVTPHIGVTGRFWGFNTSEDEDAWGSRQSDRTPYRFRFVHT